MVVTCNIMATPFFYRTVPVTLVLKDPQYADQDLGTLELAVTLTPKHSPIEERRDSMVHTELFCSILSSSIHIVSHLHSSVQHKCLCCDCVSCDRERLSRIGGNHT